MSTLYEFAGEILDLKHALDIEGLDVDSAIEAYLSSSSELSEKVDNYCALIRELSVSAEMRKSEASRLSALAQADEAKAARLRDRLLWFLREVVGVDRMNTARFTVSVVRNGGRPALVCPEDRSLWPSEYVIREIVEELDKEALRSDLEAGKVIDGFALKDRGYNLRIK